MSFSVDTWQPPQDWVAIRTIDMHTGGEPLRVILDGFPALEGDRVLDYRNFIRDHYDHLRTTLMFEPRGHADMYGVVVTPSQVADFGVVFLHNEGYSTMCGHATIAIAKLAVEAQWVNVQEPETHIRIEAPCGLLHAYVKVEDGQAVDMRFQNVSSFVVDLDQKVEVPGLGKVKYDLAYGGAFYAFVDADALGIPCTPEAYQRLIQTGMDIKRAVMAQRDIQHPTEPDLGFLYGTIFIGGPVSEGVDSRNVCIFAEGEVDRSPTGSGVSARMAIHHVRGEIGVGEWMKIESILGTTFDCRVLQTVDYEGIPAVIPEVRGTAFITGKHEFVIDPADPLKRGFVFR
ncbi:proline racemase family protein [Pontibacter sp. G13]|uniref:proline racemase family protein n=1 Tax=Pontibacter sp. G13 TaxID=3074898 RepID=UPI00288B5703|nr:proline racemase family protein [Pontibacter sp. G13]WNJ20005.1 proline racemase family protein [Pontibacter sp. G13]